MVTFGLNIFSVIPLRKGSSHQSEMVSQILFGEIFEILDKQSDWSHVRLHADGYTGWIQDMQVYPISQETYLNLQTTSILPIEKFIEYNTRSIFLPKGSHIWGKTTAAFLGQFHFQLDNIFPSHHNQNVWQTAESFLYAPYLWGGKTIFGIDCSGLVQVSFSIHGIQLPRDAYQQAVLGLDSDIYTCEPGDLAFFKNQDGKITHVGIIYSRENHDIKIIHSSSFVRIDYLDEQGIYRQDEHLNKVYTHRLSHIKRIAL